MDPRTFTAQHDGSSLTLRVPLPSANGTDALTTQALSAALPEVLEGVLAILCGFVDLTVARPEAGVEFLQEMGARLTELQRFGVSLTQE